MFFRLQPPRASRTAFLILFTVLAFTFGCSNAEPTAEEVLAEAESLRTGGRVGEAISQLENFDLRNPGDLRIVEALAFAYLDEGDPATAAMFFARAAEIDPSQAEYLLMAGEAWETAGDPVTALALYAQYLEIRPDDRAVRLSLADKHAEAGNLDAARDLLLQANRNQPDSAVQLRLGQLFFGGNNLAQAQNWFDSAARFGDESRDEALLGLLQVVLRADRLADAEELVRVIDDEFPGRLDRSELAAVRAQLETWRMRQTAAREAAQGVLPSADETLAQASPPAPTPTGESVASAPAAEPPETSPTPEPDQPPPDKEELVAQTEIRAQQAAEQTRPSGPRSLFPTGNAAGMVPPEVSRDFLAFVESAREAAATGRHQAAIKDYQRALARSSDAPGVWSELSEAQYRMGEMQAAFASVSEAIRRAPRDPRIRLQYLRVLQGSQPIRQVITEIEAAQRDFPLNAEFSLVLARAHRDAGNLRHARRYYEDFLQAAAPNHPERPNAERELNGI